MAVRTDDAEVEAAVPAALGRGCKAFSLPDNLTHLDSAAAVQLWWHWALPVVRCRHEESIGKERKASKLSDTL